MPGIPAYNQETESGTSFLGLSHFRFNMIWDHNYLQEFNVAPAAFGSKPSGQIVSSLYLDLLRSAL